ncbi:Fcf2-domain-containing protein [Trametes versicolor FP-101664 SS1]|uniref:Fcf2-domain-containing protein n=1 Tax=Trametes versicolor (strain FP-101664) TaxID=717944 RepID=UPI00046223AF|nr:Fcf2-domain-containing protein [Trametes versicolor FP-101664 SS1]EIW59053.1 Fcf2-domain-containing protein [Trametes versicolor FP-101664 SS1]
MAPTALDKGKARARAEDVEKDVAPVNTRATSPSARSSSSGSDTDSDSSDSDSDTSGSDSDSDSEDDVTQEFLEYLLAQARRNASQASAQQAASKSGEEEFIQLDSDDEGEGKKQLPLPALDTGSLPAPYITLSEDRVAGPSKLRDPDVEQAQRAASSISAPAVPAPPPEVTADGKRLTKKEAKQVRAPPPLPPAAPLSRMMKNKTAGPAWFDLPAPAEADLPRLYREVEALRLHKQLDPKQFYRKEPGEGKGIKGLPKHFAIGKIVATPNPFGKASADSLPRASRKRTLVDELVDDAEAKSYAKKKFRELQSVRGARGRGTLAAKKALRKPKW